MPRRAPLTAITPILLGTAVLTGCTAPLPVGTAEQRQQLAQLRYPADADAGKPLHVDVERTGQGLRFVNREPREFRDAVVWINQQYAGRVDRLRIGTGNTVPLNRFVNQHGEAFPTDSFLAPDDSQAVVSVELVAAADGRPTRHAMTVWPDKRWFED